ncbi:monovalent cation/H+ antiporter subunit D [Desulfosoma sp.]
MHHWVVAPILIPLGTAGVLLAMARAGLAWKRAICAVACAAELVVSCRLAAAAASGVPVVYSVGNWPAPFGIVLVVDRLAAIMVVLTAMVALGVFGYAVRGQDAQGRGFHALYQFQVLGLYGTFLTGDLFNLFVFVEILLIASYALLLQDAQGHGRALHRAGFHYVVVNLMGSSLFLVAIGLLYGVLGTVNLADLSLKMASIRPENAGLAHAAAALLLVVFALKGALVPLHFWLPSAYAAASGSVAALFALLTKAGAYAVMRVVPLLYGPEAGSTFHVGVQWILPAALATVVLGAAGALASKDLRRLMAYAVLVSMGTLFTGISLFRVDAVAASLFYLMHSTVISAGLFLLADLTAHHRDRGSELTPGPAVPQPTLLGTLFVLGGVAITGMPPLSGFAAKVLLLHAAWGHGVVTVWIWSILLLSGLALVMALQRAGSVLFWKAEPGKEQGVKKDGPLLWWPVALFWVMSLALVVGAGPLSAFCLEAAVQVVDPSAYVSKVLGSAAVGGGP